MGFTPDPVTGKPVYDGSISDPVGQFQGSADYTELMTAVTVPTFPDLDNPAYVPYKRKGLQVFVEASLLVYTCTGTGWSLLADTQEWQVLVAASGWTAGTGPNRPMIRRDGSSATYRGSLFLGSGGSLNTTATTLPAWARPSLTVRKPIVGGGPVSGIARIWSTGAFQPSVNLDADTEVSWSVR